MCVAGEGGVEFYVEMRPGGEVSSRGHLRADIDLCMAFAACPTPADVPGDIPHAHFNGTRQFLEALLPGGNASMPVASWDGLSLALRLRFDSVEHPDPAVTRVGSVFSTSDDALMVWHEGDTMRAQLSGNGTTVMLSAGAGSVEVGVWRTWTVWCALCHYRPRVGDVLKPSSVFELGESIDLDAGAIALETRTSPTRRGVHRSSHVCMCAMLQSPAVCTQHASF